MSLYLFKSNTESSSSSSTPLFRRSPKLVACVAPTSTTAAAASLPSPPPVRPSSPSSLSSSSASSAASSKVTPNILEFEKILPPTNMFAVLEEIDQEFEGVFFSEETRAVNLAAAASVKRYYFRSSPNPLLLPPSISVVRRDCAVDAHCETREAATSPLVEEDLEEGDHPEAEGLELDDEGVYFTFDLQNRANNFGEYSDKEEEGDAGSSLEPRETFRAGVRYGEGFSDLVALTTSISDDLLQLESGCQELIHRVHANRIELDRVNDSLSFVWNNKDECANAPPTSTSVSMMENSWSSGDSCSIFTHHYSPMGASFITSGGSCCPCNCHREELVGTVVDQEDPELSSEMLSSLTLVHSESLPDEKFFRPGR
ncbi:unnamed protein product [Hydatigera taeniaeformis]|uniref:Protein PHYTOCHROME KINASE SUBSTRATE 1-like n=1 Tax=Hydatigena taeniaeformis TaxID=6205 RepID=A0A0R3WW28_HYDTA|nr:unnamed protein product [Hydatigera taeniaeformis]